MNVRSVCHGVVLLVLLAGASRAADPGEGHDDAGARMLRAAIVEAIKHDDRGGAPVQLPPSAPESARAWARANREALADIGRVDGLGEQPWGPAAIDRRDGAAAGVPTRIYLYVFDWHASGQLVVYGLAGGAGKAYLLADRAKTALPFERLGASTVLTVPKDPPNALATVVVLELNGKLDTSEIVARPDRGDTGRVVMHARDAVVHGRNLRYEPQPNKDTLGFWTDPADWASWDFEVTDPGTYAVEILQGCGKGSGGSTVHASVGEQVLPFTVEDTGGFQNFVRRDVGRFTFAKPGRYTLGVKPVNKAGKAVMDLRSVTLTKAATR